MSSLHNIEKVKERLNNGNELRGNKRGDPKALSYA